MDLQISHMIGQHLPVSSALIYAGDTKAHIAVSEVSKRGHRIVISAPSDAEGLALCLYNKTLACSEFEDRLWLICEIVIKGFSNAKRG